MPDKVLELKHVNAFYKEGNVRKQILEDVNFTLYEGEIVGLVGESGSGKSTLCKCILGLLKDYEGEILHYTSSPQMVFQDPYGSLNPKKTIGWILEEPLKLKGGFSKKERRIRAEEMLERVHLPKGFYTRYPRELSGGQRQRVSIALALITGTKFVLADEPLSALDVTVQAQIMTLLNELKREFNTAIIMITHDLGVVAGICDKVLVMYAGRTMEYGNARDVFYQPVHPYSIGLLNAVPRLDAEGETMLTIPGNPPNLLRLPKGCPFQPRCPHAMEICSSAPPLEEFTPGRLRACFKPVEELL